MEHIFYLSRSLNSPAVASREETPHKYFPFHYNIPMDKTHGREKSAFKNLISLQKYLSITLNFQSFPLHFMQNPLKSITKTCLEIPFTHPIIFHFPPYFLKWSTPENLNSKIIQAHNSGEYGFPPKPHPALPVEKRGGCGMHLSAIRPAFKRWRASGQRGMIQPSAPVSDGNSVQGMQPCNHKE